MRILIVSLNFFPDLVGIGKYTGEMAQYLTQQGHQVTVVTAPPYYPLWQVQSGFYSCRYQTEIRENIKIIRCPLWVPRHVSALKRILHLVSFALSSFWVVLREAQSKPDVIFSVAPALVAALAAALAGKRYHALTWLHIQDFEIDAALNLGIIQNHPIIPSAALRFEKWIYGKFDRVSTISQKMVKRLADKGVPQEKIVFFPNWVDTSEIFPIDNWNRYRTDLGINTQDTVVLYSGSMGVKQGLEVIIRSAQLLESHSNIHFVLCGEGPTKTALQSEADGNFNIHFLPLQPTKKLNELLNMADIHLLPQKSKVADLVMPSKLHAILSSGRPVIAGCVLGSELYQVVQQVGITVAPEDATALARAIFSLAVSPVERLKLGQLGRAYAVTNWDKAHILKDLETELLKSIG